VVPGCRLSPPRGTDISGSWPAAASYYDEGHWTAQGIRSGLRGLVGANHRTLSTYLATLRRHGLRLAELAEPLPRRAGIRPTTRTVSRSSSLRGASSVPDPAMRHT
jgi:hypothetical protein